MSQGADGSRWEPMGADGSPSGAQAGSDGTNLGVDKSPRICYQFTPACFDYNGVPAQGSVGCSLREPVSRPRIKVTVKIPSTINRSPPQFPKQAPRAGPQTGNMIRCTTMGRPVWDSQRPTNRYIEKTQYRVPHRGAGTPPLGHIGRQRFGKGMVRKTQKIPRKNSRDSALEHYESDEGVSG